MIPTGLVSLGVLAGGRASRLGGADKAGLVYSGASLLARTLAAFPEPFAERLLSYNREPTLPLPPSVRVVRDLRPDFPGPLAALESLLAACAAPWLLTVPIDCRSIPPGLAETLIRNAGPDGTVVHDRDGLQPLVGLWRVAALQPAVACAFESGESAVHRLLPRLELAVSDVSPQCLGNLNTPEDFDPS